MIKFTQSAQFSGFCTFTEMCNHHHNLMLEYLHHSWKKPHEQSLPAFHPPCWLQIHSCRCGFACSRNRILCGLLWLPFHLVGCFQGHPCCSLSQYTPGFWCDRWVDGQEEAPGQGAGPCLLNGGDSTALFTNHSYSGAQISYMNIYLSIYFIQT